FKSSATYERAALDQVWDYALDLKNFHAASHARTIVPILVAAGAGGQGPQAIVRAADRVLQPLGCNAEGLRLLLRRLCAELAGPGIDPDAWARSAYQPTPTIIEAARVLYARHGVEEITRNDAGAHNLAVTSGRVRELMESCRQRNTKAVCFITGVPGAGKTLVGLDLAAPGLDGKPHGVYLSGNGPLVKVLVEALARDEVKRCALQGERKRIGNARSAAKEFIQNVHHYRDDFFARPEAPPEHVAIFDEAQRAWDQPQLCAWLSRKKNIKDFERSESALLLEHVNRRQDWALVVCLVGEEQEINTGEAGIEAWLEAVAEHFPNWEVHVPRAMPGLAGIAPARAHIDPDLHLGVCMRSFRSEAVSGFVRAALACDRAMAQDKLRDVAGNYPLVLTRDPGAAKRWLREHARGGDRAGLLVSSKAERLRPHAIDVRVKTDPVHWFLDAPSDLRSSNFLEAAATEFDVQGLEVDWA
ncbi:MAG: DNA/RNA helicase domain-containing protein, partial [Terriglobales bacterium]